MMKKNKKFIFLVVLAIVAVSGCVSDRTNSFLNQSNDITNNTQELSLSIEEQYGINLSDIPVDTPDLLKTNGSYIAGIALKDERAQELLRSGAKPVSIAVVFHSCPLNDPYCDENPKLILDYYGIRFAFTVDEDTGKLLGGTAMVPSVQDSATRTEIPYSKERDLSNHLDYVYNGSNLMMIYNDTSFMYFNESWNSK
ncbi:hypothetical protein J2128_000301 [Methanomicrobium sp. W14]|uniref:hypothetical protein n=1 Tax=Methanomicrobium sp. W14 TaxID=2817839 RepID=UPI001AE322E7|nr:hypothetical protein [Methanomicrobium sp. W14]MBP2132380.1 hypothetical protein [Methanomicrobium sp. W14]